MRVFKNKWFHHWARQERIADALLFKAAEEIAEGNVEADLGGCLFKKRLPKPGSGKRGGFRVLVGYKRHNSERLVFLYAFSKSEKANISSKEKAALSIVAESFVSSTDEHLSRLLSANAIWEIHKHD